MREHLERAVQLATEQGRPAARCEALARLALEAARLGAERKDEELLGLAERCVQETRALMAMLPGHPPWGAQAEAALARVALAAGNLPAAAAAGRAALAALDAAVTEDVYLDVILPASEAVLAAGSEQERTDVLARLRFNLALLVPRILDEDIRVRWLRGPLGRELIRLAGPGVTPERKADAGPPAAGALSDEEATLLRLLVGGQTNREIAAELRSTEESVAQRLAGLFAKMGASSRAEATAAALVGKLV